MSLQMFVSISIGFLPRKRTTGSKSITCRECYNATGGIKDFPQLLALLPEGSPQQSALFWKCPRWGQLPCLSSHLFSWQQLHSATGRYKDLTHLPQSGTTPKGHPSFRALCGVDRGLCWDGGVAQLLLLPSAASFLFFPSSNIYSRSAPWWTSHRRMSVSEYTSHYKYTFIILIDIARLPSVEVV